MSQVAIGEALTDVVRPFFKFRSVDLHGCSAVPAREVVMVDVDDATSIKAFATVSHDDVDVAALNEPLQLRVNGSEGNLSTVFHDQAVKILGTHEALDPAENADNFATLGGVSSRRHEVEPTGFHLQIGMVLSNVIGMILKKAFLVGSLVVASCSIGAGAQASEKPLIVSGVSQWGALAKALVGPDATVVSLLTDPNADPHEHEATVSDAENVTKASVVLVNGAGYDTWLTQLVNARSSHVSVVNVATLIGVHAGQNPHLFYNPIAAIRFVKALAALLENRHGFSDIRGRSVTLLAQLNAIQEQAARVKSSCSGVSVAATEDVTTYLLVDMGLKVVTPEALRLAVGNGVDPSVQDLATALNQLRRHPAFLIDNVQTATPLTNELVGQAQSSRVPVIKVTETMTGTDYVKWLNTVVKKIEDDLMSKGCLK